MSHAAPPTDLPPPADLPRLHEATILPEWIDYNGHMNLAYYVLIFDHATDKFLDYLGLTQSFRHARQASTFAAEIHVNYLKELVEGDAVYITTQLLAYDSKRLHYFHHMYHADQGYLAATNELITLYMDMQTRRVSAMPAAIQARLQAVAEAHAGLPRPPQQGSVIGVKRTG